MGVAYDDHRAQPFRSSVDGFEQGGPLLPFARIAGDFPSCMPWRAKSVVAADTTVAVCRLLRGWMYVAEMDAADQNRRAILSWSDAPAGTWTDMVSPGWAGNFVSMTSMWMIPTSGWRTVIFPVRACSTL